MIAAQAPLKATLEDWWQMIVNEKPAAIVMLCQLTEGKRPACEKYWPDSGSMTIGEFEVENVAHGEVFPEILKSSL